MIRNNKPEAAHASPKIQIHSYRNALYQGQLNRSTGQRHGKGLIYITNNNHFIACNQFVANRLNDHCFFFHAHSKYLYGTWIDSLPHGVTIYRTGEVLIIAQFDQGKISQMGRILIVFEKFNMAAILKLRSNQWEVIKKQQVINSSDLTRMIQQCQFRTSVDQIFHAPIKYLNNCMIASKTDNIKLRLLNGTYYRYGYDVGLAIIFDEEYRLVSVGVHHKTALNSFGIRFHGKNLGNKVEEGVFDGFNTYVFDQKNKPKHKIGQLYFKHHLTEVNFKNQIYRDPSEQYTNYFENILISPIITQLLKNYNHIQSHRLSDSSRNIIEEQNSLKHIGENQSRRGKIQRQYKMMQFRQFQMPTFKKSQQQKRSNQNSFKLKPINNNSDNGIRGQSANSKDTLEFESLTRKQKLQVLTKQLYQNVNHKTRPLQQIYKQNTPQKSRIITMSPVSLSLKNTNYIKNKDQVKIRQDQNRNNNMHQWQLIKQNQQSSAHHNGNLEKHLSIKLNNDGSKSSSYSHSKSRKKIFQQYSNIKRDFSPDTQVSPFKSRMKSRIFPKTPQKQSKSKSKGTHRIFSNSITPQKKETGKFNNSKTQYRLSNNAQQICQKQREKSETSSNIKTYPITLNVWNNERQNGTQNDLREQYSQIKSIHGKTNEKTNIYDYLQISKATKKEDLVNQAPRKSNSIYKNKMKSQYGQYIYQPINIKQSGNIPYKMNKQPLSKTNSRNTLLKDISKKSIGQTSPLKKQKMGAYMNEQTFGYRQAERLSDFKRRVNYF